MPPPMTWTPEEVTRSLPSRPVRRRFEWRVWAGLALIGVLVLAGNGLGVLVSSRVLSRAAALVNRPLAVTFRIPPGFVEDDVDFKLVVPLYKEVKTRWVRPTDEPPGLDVIFVNSYVTGRDEPGSPEGVRERIGAYDRQVSAVEATRPVRTQVDRMAAWTQDVYQPIPGTTGFAVYQSTYLFTGQYLVQVGCQWNLEKTEVMSGCRVVLNTLRITR